MSNCKTFKNHIEKYIDGTISDTQLVELKEHAQTCQSCREEFEQCTLLQETVKDAFSPKMSAEQAGASVVAKISCNTDRVMRPAGSRSSGEFRTPVAAFLP